MQPATIQDSSSTKTFPCIECNIHFPKKGAYDYHMKVTHRSVIEVTNKTKGENGSYW